MSKNFFATLGKILALLTVVALTAVCVALFFKKKSDQLNELFLKKKKKKASISEFVLDEADMADFDDEDFDE